MKIIGKSASGFLVEATEDEIAKAAGYRGTYDDEWRKAIGDDYRRNGLRIGTTIDITAAHSFHSRIAAHQDKARSAAGILRGLSEMLEGAMPDVIIPPAPPPTVTLLGDTDDKQSGGSA